MKTVEVRGVTGILEALQRAKVTCGEKVARGLKKAGLFLQRESQKVVPVDTGALKNSAGTRSAGDSWATDVTVFYTQSYAVYVHERTGLRHRPGKIAKFLETPAREKRDDILRIIVEEAGR